MDDNESDVVEEEVDMIALNDDDVVEVVLDEGVIEGEDEDASEEEEELGYGSKDFCDPNRDDAEFVFRKHTGAVFCCALDPKDNNIAVTGGQDDMAYIWEIQQGQVLMECEGHKDSVTMAAFSFDSSYVATGDMSGLIQVWKVATRTLSWRDTVGDLSWMQWHHGTNALFCAVTSGELFLWKIPSGECKVIPGHATATDCGLIMPDGRRSAVGYSDGVLKMFELKTGAVQGTVAAHNLAVSCLDAYSDNNIIASGGGDGKITLFKTQPLKILWCYDCTSFEEPNVFVEAVKFSKDPYLPLLVAGTLGGTLYILDFVKQVVRHVCYQETGICRMVWDQRSSAVFVGGLGGKVRVYDAKNGTLQDELCGHQDTILDICLSLDGNTLLSVSDDMTCRVYSASGPERLHTPSSTNTRLERRDEQDLTCP